MSPTPLFWQSSYLSIQSETGFFSGVSHQGLYLESRDHTQFRTWACFDFSSECIKSPCRATFGGYWSTDHTYFGADVELSVLELKSRYPGTTITFYLPPNDEASKKVSTQSEILIRLGGEVDFQDSNFSISTGNWEPSNMSKGNRKKLRQWNEAGGHVREVELESLPEIYEIIRLNRLSLGVQPSISLDGLTKLALNFGSEYRFYTATVNEEMAAVAVTVDARESAKYVFFWADVAQFRQLSPVVAICTHLIEVCRRSIKDHLDLGISTEGGQPNLGLIRFKRNLGASESPKLQISLKP